MEKRISHRTVTKLAAAVALGLAGFGVAQQADASLIVDLRATQVNGANITPTKAVAIVPGDTVTLAIWARVSGTDTVNNDRVQSAGGNIVSSNGGLLGNLSAAPFPGVFADTDGDGEPDTMVRNFADLGSQAGEIQDLDGDGDLDVGTPMTNQIVTHFFNARAASQQNPNVAVAAGTREILIGNVTFTSSASSIGETFLQFVNRVENNGTPATEGAVWLEDNVVQRPTQATYANGDPVQITAIPEPTGLALAGLAGLGLLRRRRNDNA